MSAKTGIWSQETESESKSATASNLKYEFAQKETIQKQQTPIAQISC